MGVPANVLEVTGEEYRRVIHSRLKNRVSEVCGLTIGRE